MLMYINSTQTQLKLNSTQPFVFRSLFLALFLFSLYLRLRYHLRLSPVVWSLLLLLLLLSPFSPDVILSISMRCFVPPQYATLAITLGTLCWVVSLCNCPFRLSRIYPNFFILKGNIPRYVRNLILLRLNSAVT